MMEYVRGKGTVRLHGPAMIVAIGTTWENESIQDTPVRRMSITRDDGASFGVYYMHNLPLMPMQSDESFGGLRYRLGLEPIVTKGHYFEITGDADVEITVMWKAL